MYKRAKRLVRVLGCGIASCPAPLRIALFVALLLVLWLPVYGLAHRWIADSNAVSLLTTAAVLLECLVLLRLWSRALYGSRLRDCYGLAWTQRNRREFTLGFGVGAMSLALLLGLQGLLGWTVWRGEPWNSIGAIALEGALVALGIALGEELIFRGWLLEELDRDYPPAVALWGSSLIFAVAHFIKPLPDMIRTAPQFPGLVLLGMVLVWGRRRCCGRLGLAVGLHAGLVWSYYLVEVGTLMVRQDDVPEGLAGVNNNPLAGLLGLSALAALGLWVRERPT